MTSDLRDDQWSAADGKGAYMQASDTWGELILRDQGGEGLVVYDSLQ